MTSETPEFSNILHRLETLERQNRRMKCLGAFLLISMASVLVMGQNMPGKASRVLETEKLIVRNPSGQSVITLDTADGRGSITLFRPDGFPTVILTDAANGPYLSLKTADYKHLIDMGIKYDAGGYLTFRGYNPNLKDVGPWFSITGNWEKPVLEITDKQGFRTSIGAVDLMATSKGEPAKTSAASIVMFDKDKKTIWKSPAK